MQYNTSNNNNTSGKITAEKAKEIALKHANLSKNQVSNISVHLEYDDGIQVYDVDFYANNLEYSYEINAKNGAIISHDTDSIYD